MKLESLKQQCLLWGYTLAGLALLLVAGLLLSFWIGNSDLQEVRGLINALPLGWWRGVFYGVLLMFWPRLIRRLTESKLVNKEVLRSRCSLCVLIVLYELLIVQNPLAILLGEWGDGR